MNFTCSGRITRWRAAGELPSRNSDQNDDTKLRIWRRVENDPGFYSCTQHTIALGVCNNGQVAADTIATNVYECELTSDSQVPVEPGDIVGLEIPRSTRRVFTPYFTTGVGPKNYDFVDLNVSGVVSLHDPNVTTTQSQPLIFLRVTIIATEVTTSDNLATTESPVFTDITTDQDLPTVQPSRTLLPVTADIGREKTAVSFSPKHTASVSYHDVTNNVTTADNDGNFAFRVSVMTVAVFAGLVLMAAIIVILALALVCSLRKNRKLKREMTKKGHSTCSLGDNINSSMEVILNDNTGADHVTSTIPMEENIAYNKQRRSSGYEYVMYTPALSSLIDYQRTPQHHMHTWIF